MTIPGAQYIDGQVAIRYEQPTPKIVKIGNQNIYFEVKLGISLAIVEENLVQKLLDMEGGCCGGKRKIFKLASWEAANLWRTGTRTGNVV